MKMEPIVSSETSAIRTQTPGNYPKRNKLHLEHGESLKTRLMSLALLFHYLMLNMFRMLTHPSSGACDLFVELFHGLYCSGSMCVFVTLWFGWGGVVSLRKLKPAYGYHTTTAEPQRNTITHRTRAIQPMK